MNHLPLGSRTVLDSNGDTVRRKQSMLSPRFVAKFLKVFVIIGVTGSLVIQVLQFFNTARTKNLPQPAAGYNGTNRVERVRAPLLTMGSKPSLEEIRRIVEDNNLHAEFYNEDDFGNSELISYVIVVQVHNRLHYLHRLIESLEAAPLISWTLLIFSHDYFDMDINELIQSIKFCRVMQIFYPHSLQLSPQAFPGQSASDCPPNVNREQARRINCTDWRFTDKYGHYRNAQLAQIKHHWWWKANYVFNGIERLKDFTGFVLFLEEDHYVSPDFLYTFDYMVQNLAKICSRCHMITLGRYNEMIKAEPNLDEVVK